MFLHFTLGILYLKVVSALLVEVRRIAVRRGAPGQGGGGGFNYCDAPLASTLRSSTKLPTL